MLLVRISKIGGLEASLARSPLSGAASLLTLATVVLFGVVLGRYQHKALVSSDSDAPVAWSAAMAVGFIVFSSAWAFGQANPASAAAHGMIVYVTGVRLLVAYAVAAAATALTVAASEVWSRNRRRSFAA
jgi:hypothetical protein